MVNKFRASALVLIVFLTSQSVPGQTPAPSTGKPTAPGLIKLTGDDEKRAKQLDEQIDNALKADRWDEAIARAEELLALRKRAQGPKHFETLDTELSLNTLRRLAPLPSTDRMAYLSAKTMGEHAETLLRQRKYTDAQAEFQKVLDTLRRVLGDDYADTANCYNNLGISLFEQEKFAQAQPLLETGLTIHRRLLGDDHPDTARSYKNLAMDLGKQEKYALAAALSEKALQICLRLFGDDHTDTADCYCELATDSFGQGKYALAQTLFEKDLEINRRLLTEDHPATETNYNNLASSLSYQGKFAAAQPLYEKALAIRRRPSGEEDGETASHYNNLAFNLNAQRKYAEAQPVFEKSLGIFRRVFGEHNRHTAMSYNNLAYNLGAQQKYTEAQPLLEKALGIYRRILGDNHTSTATSYGNLARNLHFQEKYAAAQPLFEKAFEIYRRQFTDDDPQTAKSYSAMGVNLRAQGKYAAAQPLFEKALELSRRHLTDNHPVTTGVYHHLAANFHAQGRYTEARDVWLRAVKSEDAVRLQAAFGGLDRAGEGRPERPALAAVLARLGQPAEAWQSLEASLGRGLLDEMAARQDRGLSGADRVRQHELTAALERFDKLAESTPTGLDDAGRAKRFEELKRERELASIALGEFQTRLATKYGALAGQVAALNEIQAALPADTALVDWVDVPPWGPNAADQSGEHWGVVVRSRGIPSWVPIVGTGASRLWTRNDTDLAEKVRTELRRHSGSDSMERQRLIENLRAQRLDPLSKALAANQEGLPPVHRMIVLPSRAMAGIPIEVLLAPGDIKTVSYAPSATVFKYLRGRPRPDGRAGLLALGDPLFKRADKSSAPKPGPDHGLLINLVARGSNAAIHGLQAGDVLLGYNGRVLNKREDVRVVTEGDKPIAIEVWRDGRTSRLELSPGALGIKVDPSPAPVAIAEQRKLHQMLTLARSGADDLAPLPGTRIEVEALARLFRSADRPTRQLLGADASEPELGGIAASGELRKFEFIHLATHGLIDEAISQRTALILTQTDLPDPLEQALKNKPVFDGRLSVREIQRGWDLSAELVTLLACETALGRHAGGEGFVGFSQALLMSGARSICLSLWKVDDKATSLLMTRFYQNLLGKRTGLSKPMPKAEALQEAKQWLRSLTVDQVDGELAALERGDVRPLARGKGAPARNEASPTKSSTLRPYDHPYYWAAFVLVGDPG